jgi:hypothetical protein
VHSATSSASAMPASTAGPRAAAPRPGPAPLQHLQAPHQGSPQHRGRDLRQPRRRRGCFTCFTRFVVGPRCGGRARRGCGILRRCFTCFTCFTRFSAGHRRLAHRRLYMQDCTRQRQPDLPRPARAPGRRRGSRVSGDDASLHDICTNAYGQAPSPMRA